MKKYILVYACCIGIFASCQAVQEKRVDLPKREDQIAEVSAELSARYFRLLEDPIQERKRAKLEKQYQRLYKSLHSLVKESEGEDLQFLKTYEKDAKVKLNYLKDLKGE